MKPEELDRLFRDELEKLDHVPGIEWNETGAWDKLKIQLKGGWNSGIIWSVSIIMVTVVVLLFYIVLNHKDTPVSQKHRPSEESLPVKVDSIYKNEEKKKVQTIKKSSKINRVFVKAIDTMAIIAVDTITVPLPQEKPTESAIKTTTILRKDKGIKLPIAKPDFNFKMPEQSVLRMKVNNQFNVSNLIKSIEAEKNAGENFYYHYEYNKNFIPPPYEGVYKRNSPDQPEILTNFNK